MLVGQLLEYNNTTVYSRPQPSQSLQATCIVDVDVVVGSPTLVAAIQSKKRSATSWTTLGTFSAITGTGIHKLDVSAIEELVRWAFTFTGGSNGDSTRIEYDMIYRSNAN